MHVTAHSKIALVFLLDGRHMSVVPLVAELSILVAAAKTTHPRSIVGHNPYLLVLRSWVDKMS